MTHRRFGPVLLALRCNFPDHVGSGFGKPEVAVGPAAIPSTNAGLPGGTLGTSYVVDEPLVVIFVIVPAEFSVNQRLPSGPAAMPYPTYTKTAYSVNEPLVVIFPIPSYRFR